MIEYNTEVTNSTLSKGTLSVPVSIGIKAKHLQFAINTATGRTLFDKADGDSPAASKVGNNILITLGRTTKNLAVGDSVKVFFQKGAADASFDKLKYKQQILDVVDKNSQMDQLGESGVNYISHADALPTNGTFFAFAVVEQCTFHGDTEVPTGHEKPPITFTFPAGTIIYGIFNKIKLATGKGIGYIKDRGMGESFIV